MKTAKELKKYVFSRMMCCCGELCMIFFLSVGGISIFVLAFILAVNLMTRPGAVSFYPEDMLRYGWAVIAVFLAVIVLLMVAAAPFAYGTGWYRIQQIRGNSVHARSIFSCYASVKKLWQVLRINSILIIKRLYVMLPFALVSAWGFYVSDVIEKYSDSRAAYYTVFGLAVIVTLCLICLFILYNVRYAAVMYLYVLEPGKSPSELISESKKIMHGKAGYMTEVMLSVSGWLIPCIIIFPMIFIVPYLHMTYTAAVNEIIMYENGEELQIGGAKIPKEE